MSPAYVNSGWAGISSAGHKYVFVGTPDSVVVGNLLIAVYQSNVALTGLTAPDGWQLGDVVTSTKSFWLYKIADGTEGDTIEISWNETTYVFGQAFQISGVNASDLFGALVETEGVLNPILIDGVYTTAANSLVVCIELLSYNAGLPTPSGFDAGSIADGQDASAHGYGITISSVAIADTDSPAPAVGATIPNYHWAGFQIELLAPVPVDVSGTIISKLNLVKQLVAAAQIGGAGTGGWYSWWMNG